MKKSTNHEFRYRRNASTRNPTLLRSLIKALVMLVAFTLPLVSSPVRVHDEVEVSFQTFSDQLGAHTGKYAPNISTSERLYSRWDIGSKGVYPGRPAMRLPGPAWNIEVWADVEETTNSLWASGYVSAPVWVEGPPLATFPPPRPSSSCRIRTTRWTQIMTIPKRG